ncbi:MAG: aromatic ring-hydroxylating dioxygenase subunit alpha [Gammaproteobacteria bacterium]|nr:aromatic ring-hydroxylating dioxygenase subunit alpha [Gammaproteobacteria bacterium]
MGLEKTLPKDYYFSTKIFAEERERIFFSQWFCVGRASEVAATGDYFAVDLCGESIIVVRDESGDLNAFYNVCRHRGSQLIPMVSEGEKAPACLKGRIKDVIRCPYHSWTYGLDGTFKRAPHVNDIEPNDPEFALHAVDVDCWGGFVFVRLSPGNRGLELLEQLGEIPERLNRYPLDELCVAKRIIYPVKANWKVVLENYNECYHCAGVHPELCRVVPAFKYEGGANLDWNEGIPHREGAVTFTFDGTTKRAPFPGLNESEKIRHNGELAYPNLMISLSCDHVAAFVIWPVGVDETRIVCDFLFHPDEIAKADFDPADAVDFWDLTNRQDWNICENVQRGMASRAFDGGYYAPMEDLSLDIRDYIRKSLPEKDPD